MRKLIGGFSVLIGLGLFGTAFAQDVRITQDMSYFEFESAGEFYVIERNQNQEAVIENSFAKTSRPCPPFCIHAMSAGEGVETVGELELMDFIDDFVQPGIGFLVDARTPDWYEKGTIPGSINLPFTLFLESQDNPFRGPLLTSLGGRRGPSGTWDFSNALDLLLFCNGPWCDQSPRAIRALMEVGYPPERLRYYRGGMQTWLLLGLTVTVPTF